MAELFLTVHSDLVFKKKNQKPEKNTFNWILYTVVTMDLRTLNFHTKPKALSEEGIFNVYFTWMVRGGFFCGSSVRGQHGVSQEF